VRVALDVSAVPAKIAGAGRYIAEVADRLPELDVDTTLVTRRGDTARWRARSPRATIAALVPNNRGLRLAYEATRLGSTKVARGVDVWHAPHYTMPRGSKTPMVVTIHDLTLFTHPEWHERAKVNFFQRAMRYSTNHAKVLVCVSDFTARELRDVLAPSARVVVAPLGVDHGRFHPDASADGALLAGAQLHASKPYLFFLGTLEPRKGLDVLLRAFGPLAALDDELELWIAGQSGWGLGPLADAIRTHPYASRIRRLGFVDEELLPALLRQARVVVYPSRGEGFGLPVLEAMACGATVVTTRDTVMAEVAGDGAVLTTAGDERELGQSLFDLLAESNDERRARVARALANAAPFTWERTMSVHLEAYRLAAGS